MTTGAMLLTSVTTKRLTTLPLILLMGTLWNVFYGFHVSKSPVNLSKVRPLGPNEIHHLKTHRETAIQKFASQQKLSSSFNDGPKSLHKLHKQGRPSLIFHIGPEYTFASDLQAHLRLLVNELKEDKFEFGDFPFLTDVHCHTELNLARRKYQVKFKKKTTQGKSLKDFLSTEVKCWRTALAALDVYRAKGISVIVSDESISKQWQNLDGLHSAPMDWIALEETLGDDWNLEIVVGYRRFAEWLPEAIRGASGKRHSGTSATTNEDKSNHTLPKLRKDIHVIPPLFPDIVDSAAATGQVVVGADILNNATFTTQIVERYLYRAHEESKIPISILNVHVEKSLGTLLVCDILYTAIHACRVSSKRTAALSRIEADGHGKRHYEPVQANDFYEIMAGYCAEHELYPTKEVSVQEAAISFRYYHEQVLHKTLAEMVVKCPTPEELQKLLDISIQHERNLLPAFADTHDGETEHRRMFLDAPETHQFLCQIDVKKVINDRAMRDFARALPSGVPDSLFPARRKKEVQILPEAENSIATKDYVDSHNQVAGKVTVIRRHLVLPVHPPHHTTATSRVTRVRKSKGMR